MSERDAFGVLAVHSSTCKGICCVPETPYKLSSLYAQTARQFGETAAEDFHYLQSRLHDEGSWWSLHAEELLATENRLAAEYAATRAQREAAEAAAVEAFERKNKVERKAIQMGLSCNRHGVAAIRKIAQPCKFLYNCEDTPARPTTKHITTECWSHAKGVCDRMHPGEAGWHAEWQNDRTFKPVGQADRFAFAAQKKAGGR